MTATKKHIKYLKLIGYVAFGVAALNIILIPIYFHNGNPGAGFNDVAIAFIGASALLIGGALQNIDNRLDRIESATQKTHNE